VTSSLTHPLLDAVDLKFHSPSYKTYRPHEYTTCFSFFIGIDLFFLVKFQKDVMQHILKRARSFFAKSSQRFAEIIYVPSPTGSHDVGDQYLGDAASTYVEHKDFPDSARLPFRGVVMFKRK
jgi:hypothetical protein